MTTTKHRALQALADAKGRTFLAAAPLMAIVEAVAVLDEAGLLIDLDAPIPYAVVETPEPEPAPQMKPGSCPKCSEQLFRDGTCMNFPACPNATLPF